MNWHTNKCSTARQTRQQRRRLGVALTILLCLAYAAGFVAHGLWRRAGGGPPGGAPEAKVFWEAWTRVEKHFYGPLSSPRARTYGAIRRSLSLLDRYTTFVEPNPGALERDRLRGSYGGIGATICQSPQGDIALEPHPDSPAERAGLLAGDVLVAIDGAAIGPGTTPSAVQAKLRGRVGTCVDVTVRRSSGATFTTSVERHRIEEPSVIWRMVTAATAYIRVTRFTERTPTELDAVLEDVERVEAGAVVLDLRGNRGGLLDSAVAVASRFLNWRDVVAYEIDDSGERVFRAHGDGYADSPLVALVDGGTASGTEIVAGALQDHGRAQLIGERTLGKGSVQEIYNLSDGSSLHVTVAVWLTPDRHRIEATGLTPDIPVAPSDEPGDEVLSRALQVLESE